VGAARAGPAVIGERMLLSYPYVLAGAACLGLVAANVFRAAEAGLAVAAVGAAPVAAFLADARARSRR
jgi:hypothetical protein